MSSDEFIVGVRLHDRNMDSFVCIDRDYLRSVKLSAGACRRWYSHSSEGAAMVVSGREKEVLITTCA